MNTVTPAPLEKAVHQLKPSQRIPILLEKVREEWEIKKPDRIPSSVKGGEFLEKDATHHDRFLEWRGECIWLWMQIRDLVLRGHPTGNSQLDEHLKSTNGEISDSHLERLGAMLGPASE